MGRYHELPSRSTISLMTRKVTVAVVVVALLLSTMLLGFSSAETVLPAVAERVGYGDGPLEQLGTSHAVAESPGLVRRLHAPALLRLLAGSQPNLMAKAGAAAPLPTPIRRPAFHPSCGQVSSVPHGERPDQDEESEYEQRGQGAPLARCFVTIRTMPALARFQGDAWPGCALYGSRLVIRRDLVDACNLGVPLGQVANEREPLRIAFHDRSQPAHATSAHVTVDQQRRGRKPRRPVNLPSASPTFRMNAPQPLAAPCRGDDWPPRAAPTRETADRRCSATTGPAWSVLQGSRWAEFVDLLPPTADRPVPAWTHRHHGLPTVRASRLARR